MKFLIALDFDGVLVDSARELALSGFDAAKLLFPGAPWLTNKLRRPDQLEERLLQPFCDVRPCLETGWEAPILLKLLLDDQQSIESILENFQHGLRDETMKKLGVSNEDCNNALKEARNTWISSDDNAQDWLDAHDFYEGACDAVRQKLESLPKDRMEDVVIITTKAADFTKRLLEKECLYGSIAPNGGILDHRIFGLGSPPKEQVLANLLEEKSGNEEEWAAVFVEDRLLTLDKTMAPDTSVKNRVLPVVASWGYNTPEQRAAGKQAGYIVLSETDSSTLSEVLEDEKAATMLKELQKKL